MNKTLFLSALAASALIAGAASAGTVIPVGPFHSVGIDGMGHVTFKHGNVQRVVLVKGDTSNTKIYIDSPGNLEIKSCSGSWWSGHSCPWNYEVDVEITTPELHGVAISGSGKIDAQGPFPAQDRLNIAISGSGAIDLRNVPAHNVDTAIDGSGDVRVTVDGNLHAAISGSGKILYWGNPKVSEDISGSGVIRQGS